jgi:ELWxxDGT repeat protein
VLFNAYEPGAGYELWRSDGTPDGTQCVRDIIAGIGSSWPYGLTVLEGTVYFSAYGEGEGRELWRSDGTEGGTALVRDIFPGGMGSAPDWLQAWKGRLWFTADDGAHGVEPWSSDGTLEGTRRFAGLAPDIGSSAIRSLVPWGAGGALLETEERAGTPYQFWASDGTPEGTQPFYTLDPAANWRPPGELASRGDLAFFPLFSAAFGNEMWRTDGTAAGTRLVRDSVPGPPDSVDSAFRKGAFLGADYFFSGSDGVHGLEPWATDGTATGTRMVADLCTEPQEFNPTASSWPAHFTAGSGRVFFTARGDDGSAGWYAGSGAVSGTRLLTAFGVPSDQITILPSAVAGATAFLFTQEQWTYRWDLWRSDGTPQGTALAASLYAGWENPWTPGPLYPFGGRVFFSAAHTLGDELWVSDGTHGGTHLLKDIDPGEGDSFPAGFVALGDRFYFRADDGVHGAELWTSDGTEAGTYMLTDLCPGLCSSYPMHLASDGTRIIFSATDGIHGHELWTSDGTAEGTRMEADLRPGPASSAPAQFTPSGPTVYFTADDGRTGRELWRYDLADPEP